MSDRSLIIPPGEALPPRVQPAASGSGAKPVSAPPVARDPAQYRQAAGRFSMLNSFIDSGMASLSCLQALVWLTLFRDARGDVATTSAEYIAKRAGISRRSVTEALKVLKDRGLISVQRRGGLNRGANTYRIAPRGKEDRAN